MSDAQPTHTACACGGTFFRVDTTVFAVFYISDGQLRMDVNPVYHSHLHAPVMNCLRCGARMDLSGLCGPDGQPVDPRALGAALSEMLEDLRNADIMTEVTCSF